MPVALLRFSLRSFPLRTEPRHPSRGRLPSCRCHRQAHILYELPFPRLQGLAPRRSPLRPPGLLRPGIARCSLGLLPLQGFPPRRDGSSFLDPPPLELPASCCLRSRSVAPFGVLLHGEVSSPLARLPPLLGFLHLLDGWGLDERSRPRREPRTRRIASPGGSVYGRPVSQPTIRCLARVSPTLAGPKLLSRPESVNENLYSPPHLDPPSAQFSFGCDRIIEPCSSYSCSRARSY